MSSRRPLRYDTVPDSPRPRGRGAGVLLSIVLHISVVLLLLIPLRRDFARVLNPDRLGAGPNRGGSGGGGGRVAYISLPVPKSVAPVEMTVDPPVETPPPEVVTPPVTPPPNIVPPEPAAQPVASAAAADSVPGSGPGQGGGTGGGEGGGLGPGIGPGTGPGTGAGDRSRAPQPRHLIIPPVDAPKEMRGVTIKVTFWIDATGAVARVEFDPPVDDRTYAKKLGETMRNYRFRPALGPEGTPIPSTYVYTVTAF